MKNIGIISTICLLFLFSFQSFAQLSVGVGGGMFKIIDSDRDVDAIWGPGATIKVELTQKLRIGANLSYYFKTEEVIENIKWTSFIMPVSGLFEYSFSEGGINPYLGANIGTYISGARMDGESESESYFGFAPTAGLDVDISENFLINAGVKFHLYFFENYLKETEGQGAFGADISILYRF